MSNLTVSVHILRNHFRGVGGQDDDFLDYAGGGGQNLAKVDYVICAQSLSSNYHILNSESPIILYIRIGEFLSKLVPSSSKLSSNLKCV